ncbi:cell division protein CrgA [Sinomonas susongensis]|uniref:cell division protein CrgA n=1 Tax=Sinomonas susongensis TaxID=1324851 RepID=UPI001FE6F536|nr:cell division protein CrgA [Sinomonas susongensis]
MPESTEKPEPTTANGAKKPLSTKVSSAKTAPKKDARRPKAKKKRRPARVASGPTPQWYKYLMFTLMVVGLLWIIVFYVTQGLFPVPAFGNWNILIGFAIAIAGFLMTLRWRG